MDQTIYVGMAEPIRKTHTILTDEKTMAQEIDRVIEAGVKSKLPVYIYVPMDVVGTPLDASRLEKPLSTEVVNSNSQMEDEVVKSTLELIKNSSKPSILADVLTIRHGGRELARRLASATQFPTYSTPLSKGVFDETDSKYNGVYNGEGKVKSPRWINHTECQLSSFFPWLCRLPRELRPSPEHWIPPIRLQHWRFHSEDPQRKLSITRPRLLPNPRQEVRRHPFPTSPEANR